MVIDIFLYIILILWHPQKNIDATIDFPYKEYGENKDNFGDHNFKIN